MDEQVRYYTAKLQHEIDPWDLNEAPIAGATTAIRLMDWSRCSRLARAAVHSRREAFLVEVPHMRSATRALVIDVTRDGPSGYTSRTPACARSSVG